MPRWAWTIAGIALAALVYAAFVVWRVLRGRRGDARALATLIPDCIVLVMRLALVLRRFVRSGGVDLIRELWPGPPQSLSLIVRLAGATP